jgi:hypothetical protein
MNREMLQSTSQVGEWYVLLFALLIIDCDISISFKLRAYYLFQILKFIKELQTKYRCLDCDPSGVKWDWIQEFKRMHKPYHTRLDNRHLDTWATHIVEKTATKFFSTPNP